MNKTVSLFNNIQSVLYKLISTLISLSGNSTLAITKLIYFCLAFMLFVMAGMYYCYHQMLAANISMVKQCLFLFAIALLGSLLVLTGVMFGKLCRRFMLHGKNKTDNNVS